VQAPTVRTVTAAIWYFFRITSYEFNSEPVQKDDNDELDWDYNGFFAYARFRF
jgi:hypothetical protein